MNSVLQPPSSILPQPSVEQRERIRHQASLSLQAEGKLEAPGGRVFLVSILCQLSFFISVSHLIPQEPLWGGRMGFLIQRCCLSHTSHTAAST